MGTLSVRCSCGLVAAVRRALVGAMKVGVSTLVGAVLALVGACEGGSVPCEKLVKSAGCDAGIAEYVRRCTAWSDD